MISDTVTRAQVSKNLKCVCQKLNGSRPTRGLFSSIRTCQICGGCHLCTLWNGALLIFALIMQCKFLLYCCQQQNKVIQILMMSDRNQNYTFSIDCIVDLISIDFRFWLMMWVFYLYIFCATIRPLQTRATTAKYCFKPRHILTAE